MVLWIYIYYVAVMRPRLQNAVETARLEFAQMPRRGKAQNERDETKGIVDVKAHANIT